MSFITSLIGIPLGWIMYFCYMITSNYALSLLLFTIIARAIMIPLTIKQQKSTVKMTMLKPELDEIQKKYANNKEKLNEEMMKLYSREGYSPMSGCLPLLVQLPILFGLIDVIYKPLTHILRMSSTAVDAAKAIVMGATESANANTVQLRIIEIIKNPADALFSRVSEAIGPESVGAIQELNLNIFGINLTDTPSWSMFGQIFSNFNPVIFIPIVAGLTSFLMSIITTRNQSGTAMEGAAGASMKGMMFTMPIFSLVFTFSVPAGVGLYWCYSNVIGAAQTFLMHKFFNPKEAAEKARQEMEARMERERLERIEAKKKDPNKGLSQKEINRRKLAAARKRDAEKYGEEYVEVTDSDIV